MKKKRVSRDLTRIQRMFKHIVENYLDRGYSVKDAEKRAAMTVNRYRAKSAKKHKGPKLISKGGTRHQWYPGKKLAGKKAKKTWQCLKHKRKFKSKAGLLTHYRSHAS
jgi:hypothetical protein